MITKRTLALFCALLFVCVCLGIQPVSAQEEAIPIRVLLLPKFEVGELFWAFPGEAQFNYEAYLQGDDEYEIAAGFEGNKLYVKDGAMYITGMGEVNAALSTVAVLSDPRFDFSGAYVISTSGDNYWKGLYDHRNALRMAEAYGCPDPYALTEMEDVTILGAIPESLWGSSTADAESLASEDSVEAADIFATAMQNNFNVGSVLVNAILSGKLDAEGALQPAA